MKDFSNKMIFKIHKINVFPIYKFKEKQALSKIRLTIEQKEEGKRDISVFINKHIANNLIMDLQKILL